MPNASFEKELEGKQASLTEAHMEIHLNARGHAASEWPSLPLYISLTQHLQSATGEALNQVLS